MGRKRMVGLLIGLLALASCDDDEVVEILETDDRRVPTDEVHLPDGRHLRVVAGEADVHDELEVAFEPVLPARGASAEVHAVVTNRGSQPVLIALPDDDRMPTTTDGVTLIARPFDLPYERGEVVYAEPPRTPVALAPADSSVAVGGPLPSTIAEGIVCFEAAEPGDPFVGGDPSVAGQESWAHFRKSDAPLSLVCGDATERATEPIEERRWVGDLLGTDPVEPVPGDRAPVRLAGVDDGDGTIELSLSPDEGPPGATDGEDVEFALPDPADVGVVAGRARWWPRPDDAPTVTVPADATRPVTVGLETIALGEHRQPGASSAEVCVAARGDGDADLAGVCTSVAEW
ncbi:hypothetical protein ER308_04800 [Egibacter rhizosphaerae]|uniref:Uncharacterized protein n=1 Tax=Egibacter rhizosphaerae TaxID=1670831 RepID=A0A411YCL1_9ACTN|nr:hypothetical protein [Egibacter rhizosphaerae]QBI18928.1 hypothetical protein ER308_04800 [Egibacter rhizosphaerae]